MDETPKAFSPEPYAPDAGKWIGRVLIAVILGEGIWGLIVSLTNNLLLPFLARNMGGDVQSPLYLGKGDFNVPALFTSVLEFCFAGIAAVIVNIWVKRQSNPARSRSGRVSATHLQSSAPLPSPSTAGPVQATPSVSSTATAPSTSQFWSPPEPSQPKATAPPAPAAKPAKPKPPKEVRYNIVGEPISPIEDE